MMKKIIRIITILFCIVHYQNIKGQDPDFRQFYLHDSYYNPAASGVSGLRISMSYQQLYHQIHNNPVTSYLSIDFPFIRIQSDDLFTGFGVSVIQNTQGDAYYSSFIVSPIISLSIGGFSMNDFLRCNFGFKSSFVTKSINYSSLYFADQYHPVAGLIDDRSAFFNYVDEENNKSSLIYCGFGTLFRIILPPESAISDKTNQSLWKWKIITGMAVDNKNIQDFNEDLKILNNPLPFKFVHSTIIIKPIRTSQKQWADLVVTPGIIYERYASEKIRDILKPNPSFETTTFGFNLFVVPKIIKVINSGKVTCFSGIWIKKRKYYESSLLNLKYFDVFSIPLGIGIHKNNLTCYIGLSYDFSTSSIMMDNNSLEYLIRISFNPSKDYSLESLKFIGCLASINKRMDYDIFDIF